ncbi:MAG TPA: bifunctional homocysteine S-methyltransferase/methylenetetrahydrofolate reductase [Candidatus Limnocylindrales bacterium]
MTDRPAAPAAGATARDRFRERLRRAPLLADGAMGTLLFSRGIPQRASLDELIVSRPELIATIHREYLEAGAELIETATFGANRIRLAGYGLAAQAGRLNRRGAQLARDARDVAGREAFVAGSVGPLSGPNRGAGTLPEAVGRAAFREQLEALLEGGVDLFVLETFSELEPLLWAVAEARAAADVPIVASLTFGEELATADDTSPAAAAASLAEAGVDVVGVNCGVGPLLCLDALARMDDSAGRPLPRSIMPNAGLPQRIEGQFVYAAGPAYFGEVVGRFVDAGARIVGGCCGTTPAHVGAMRAALDALATSGAAGSPSAMRAAGRQATAATAIVEIGPQPTGAPRSAVPEAAGMATAPGPSSLARKLAAGGYVVSVEIDPPRSIRIERTLEAARLLRDAGADLVNVSDSAMARVRMGCLAVAFAIQQQVGLEALIHLTTRDRNLMALESELLGAHALGVRDVLALTGDPPRVGDYPTGTGVWDVDSIGLIEILRRLNRGEDAAGAPIGQPAGFTVACALDPTAADPEREWDRLARKLDAGADLVMTQPLYDLAQVEAMLDEARRRFGASGFPVPVLLGVLPLHSSRHAEFLHNEVPGITIPESQRRAMRAAGERGAEVGLEMALGLLEQVGDLVAGTYVMPSFGRYELAAELVGRLRSRRAQMGSAARPDA